MKVTTDFKMAIIIDDSSPKGLQCNAAAVLSLTLGNKIEGLFGPDLHDKSGALHIGITKYTLPILAAPKEKLQEMYLQALQMKDELLLVDFTDVAQMTHDYDEYSEKLKKKNTEELTLSGIAIAGNKKVVNKLTGNLPLVR